MDCSIDVTFEPGRSNALDDAVSAVFVPLDLQATLDAAVDLFVPRYADGVDVTLAGEDGAPLVVAARHRDPELDEVWRAQVGRRCDALPPNQGIGTGALTLPLALEDDDLGAIHLCRAAGAPVFTAEQVAFLRAIAHRCAQALRNARRFEHERSVALAFQHAALVSVLPRLTGYRFDAIYQAGRAEALVGGDWYDAFALRDGRIVVSIGDVVGSGLDAAIAMVNVRQVIRGVAQVHPDPAVMLEAADRTLRAQHPDRFVTAFVGVIDPVTQRCAFANAGHPAPRLRLPGGAIQQTHGRGFPLGLDFDQKIEVEQILLPPGSVFVMFTDGLIESTRDVNEGERRLDAALRDPRLTESDDIARRLHREVLGADARDDVAILVVAIEVAPPVRRWRFDPVWDDAANRAHRELCAELLASGYPAAALVDVELVFSEVMGNLVRHAPGTAEVILERRDGAFVLHVLDKGPGFEFSPRLPPDLYSECGRGLFLISRMTRDFTVERRLGGGSHARIIL